MIRRAGFVCCLALARAAAAQMDGHSMGAMSMPAAPLGLSMARVGAGTAWTPDRSPVDAFEMHTGQWHLMLHGAVFGEFDHQNGFRGDAQTGVIDWEMLMATRPLAGGLFRVEAMTSVEALALGRRGYPELLQTGGTYAGTRLVNRQHPNDLVMELASSFDHAVNDRLAASVYVAVVGEPALGPVAYMHRPSAADDPFAPLGHHWQDMTHASDGVVTAGLYSRAVKLEGSVFNARESDSYRYNIDYSNAKLDSYSGRLTVMPVSSVAVSAWGGYLFGHDLLEPTIGMQLYGASVLTSTAGDGERRGWSNAVVWGYMIHHHGTREHNHDPTETPKLYHVSSSVLLESEVGVARGLSVYGRAEQVQKNADDLGFLAGDPTMLFTVRSVSVGATKDFLRAGRFTVGVGGRGSLTLLPSTLRLVYQTTQPTGYTIYLRIRP